MRHIIADYHKLLTIASFFTLAISLLCDAQVACVQVAVWEMPQTWGEAVQTNDYYPDGTLISTSTGQQLNRRKFGGKELETRSALNAYDQQARQYFAPALRFDNPDPLAANRPSESPYIFCANNPVNYVDPDGRKLTFVGTYNNCVAAMDIINRRLPGSYIGLSDGNIIYPDRSTIHYSVSKNANRPDYSDNNRRSHALTMLDAIIDSEEDVIVSVCSNSIVPIGHASMKMIDVEDMNRMGNGPFVNAFGAIFHEIIEQYMIQTQHFDNGRAHLAATQSEGIVNGCEFDYLRENISGMMAVTFQANGQQYQILIYFDNEHNITSVSNPMEMSLCYYQYIFLLFLCFSNSFTSAKRPIEHKLELIHDEFIQDLPKHYLSTNITDSMYLIILDDIKAGLLKDYSQSTLTEKTISNSSIVRYLKKYKTEITTNKIQLLLILTYLLNENESDIQLTSGDSIVNSYYQISKEIIISNILRLRESIETANMQHSIVVGDNNRYEISNNTFTLFSEINTDFMNYARNHPHNNVSVPILERLYIHLLNSIMFSQGYLSWTERDKDFKIVVSENQNISIEKLKLYLICEALLEIEMKKYFDLSLQNKSNFYMHCPDTICYLTMTSIKKEILSILQTK